MEHNFIKIEERSNLQELVIYHKDYNLDKLDNLDSLPEASAVYAICGRVNGQPANARFIDVTNNLRAAVKSHYSATEGSDCLRTFMQSIKTKTLVFEVLLDAGENGLNEKKNEWELNFKPQCTEKMNEVY